MKSPFLTKMRKKNCEVVKKNMNLEQFKDHLIQFLTAARMINGEIVDIEFGLPSKGCVPLEIYIKKEPEVGDKPTGRKKISK